MSARKSLVLSRSFFARREHTSSFLSNDCLVGSNSDFDRTRDGTANDNDSCNFVVGYCCCELSKCRNGGGSAAGSSFGSAKLLEKAQRRFRGITYPPFWVAKPVVATSVIVALLAMFARSAIASPSVGVGAAETNCARTASPVERMESFIFFWIFKKFVAGDRFKRLIVELSTSFFALS